MTSKKNNCLRNNAPQAKARDQPLGRVNQGTTGDKKSDPVVTIVQRTSALCRGLDQILQHHNAKKIIRDALSMQCHSYLDNSGSELIWLKRCKHLLTFPLAKYLRNDLPPPPDVVISFTGKLRKWIRNRLNSFSDRNCHLWYSWFQAKRSTLPLSEDIIEQTYDTHLETLTKEDPGVRSTINEIFEDPTFKKVLDQVRKFVGGNYSNKQFPDTQPKNSACFEHGRSFGGQAMTLREFAGLPTYSKDEKPILNSGPELYEMVYRPWVYTKEGRSSNFCQERFVPYGAHEWTELEYQARKLDLSKPLNCTIQAVLEPNKIRVISKGNAIPYYGCRPLQKALFDALKVIPAFTLISRPLFTTDIIPLAEKAQKDWEWFSVDYSAATDGLSWIYSGEIFKYVIQDLPEHDRALAMSVLGPHALHYPARDSWEVTLKGIQKNGQLMGSILSFPILCLANLGVYLRTTRDLHESWTHKERLASVLINGDDMVYCAPKALWTKHISVGKDVGLEMSVGKAYVHREYLNINSQSILFPLHKEEKYRCPKPINFLNTGLFYGLHKVQGKTDNGFKTAEQHSSAKDGLVININKLLEGALPNKKCDLLKEFLTVHKTEVLKECSIKTYMGKPHVRNLFIAEKLGGMGVIPPIGWKYKVTTSDLYVAHGFLKRYPDVSYTTERPLPGHPFNIDKDVVVPWSLIDEPESLEHVPEKQIKFKKLKMLCRSPAFEFYVPFETCLFATPRRERKEKRKSSKRPKKVVADTEDLSELLRIELSLDSEEDFEVPSIDDLIQTMRETGIIPDHRRYKKGSVFREEEPYVPFVPRIGGFNSFLYNIENWVEEEEQDRIVKSLVTPWEPLPQDLSVIVQ